MSNFAQTLASIFASFVALFHSTPPPAPPVPAPHTTVLFGGDMMFDRSIRSRAMEKGGDYLFSCLDPLLEGEKLVVANLEGPITDHASKSTGTAPGSTNNMIFTFPTSTAPLLAKHNIDLVNLGNNHIGNFGKDGVSTTIAHLDDAGVAHFGDTLEYRVTERDEGGVPLSFVNFNEFGGNATTTVEQIIAAREKGRHPIVYTHWGEEYASTTPEYIRTLAHRFVDAGAELVIGSHPHVVGEREFYLPRGASAQRGAEKYIYYSLGNLIFDQYWDSEVSTGLLVRVAFDAKGVLYVEEIPVTLGRDGRTCPQRG